MLLVCKKNQDVSDAASLMSNAGSASSTMSPVASAHSTIPSLRPAHDQGTTNDDCNRTAASSTSPASRSPHSSACIVVHPPLARQREREDACPSAQEMKRKQATALAYGLKREDAHCKLINVEREPKDDDRWW